MGKGLLWLLRLLGLLRLLRLLWLLGLLGLLRRLGLAGGQLSAAGRRRSTGTTGLG